MEINEKDLDQEDRLEKIVDLFSDISFLEWQIIEKHINNEFSRLAERNRIDRAVARKVFEKSALDMEVKFSINKPRR